MNSFAFCCCHKSSTSSQPRKLKFGMKSYFNPTKKIETWLRKVGTTWTPYSTMQWFRLRRAGGTCIFARIFWHGLSFARRRDAYWWRFWECEVEEERGISTLKFLHAKNICHRDPQLWSIKGILIILKLYWWINNIEMVKKGPIIAMDTRPSETPATSHWRRRTQK